MSDTDQHLWSLPWGCCPQFHQGWGLPASCPHSSALHWRHLAVCHCFSGAVVWKIKCSDKPCIFILVINCNESSFKWCFIHVLLFFSKSLQSARVTFREPLHSMSSLFFSNKGIRECSLRWIIHPKSHHRSLCNRSNFSKWPSNYVMPYWQKKNEQPIHIITQIHMLLFRLK